MLTSTILNGQLDFWLATQSKLWTAPFLCSQTSGLDAKTNCTAWPPYSWLIAGFQIALGVCIAGHLLSFLIAPWPQKDNSPIKWYHKTIKENLQRYWYKIPWNCQRYIVPQFHGTLNVALSHGRCSLKKEVRFNKDVSFFRDAKKWYSWFFTKLAWRGPWPLILVWPAWYSNRQALHIVGRKGTDLCWVLYATWLSYVYTPNLHISTQFIST